MGILLFFASAIVAAMLSSVSAHAEQKNDQTLFAQPRTAFVHLFEWKWSDIALECENFLGPKGFAAVQISPPQEHVVLEGRPWYERYQPVSYTLESRGGTREEFTDMVRRCRAVGVEIYADAVINHTVWRVMDGQVHHGSAGTPFSEYNHPGLYAPTDFHRCGRNGNDTIANYLDRWEVQNCNLDRCSDLKTESDKVRATLANYLNDLQALGVTGFRIDGAKHIPSNDLENILGRAGNPYVYVEVVGNDAEPVKVSEYMHLGLVSEFKFGFDLGRVFRGGKLSWLQNLGEPWQYLPSHKAVTFLANHDTERTNAGYVLTSKDGKLFVLGNVFMLAWPYGYPQVLSAYPFVDHHAGPPMNRRGDVLPVYENGMTVRCFKEWGCEHRIPAIANMVGFRNFTSPDFHVTKWWSDGESRIAFARGNKGFVVINNTNEPFRKWFDTGLAAGLYCDVISGEPVLGSTMCSGKTIQVTPSGWANIEVGAMEAAAIHGGARPLL